ncbi:hypothetical protein P4K96_30655 [Bacillus cereus]|nr:hypothetical protein [Bacillus cereus]
MLLCDYCREELITNERSQNREENTSINLCSNENCEIHQVKNLYFKPWFLSKEQIEEKLKTLDVSWKWSENRFFLYVTPETNHWVRSQIKTLKEENGAILFDSRIDYVFSSKDEISEQTHSS